MKIPDAVLINNAYEALRERESEDGVAAINDTMRTLLVVWQAHTTIAEGGFRIFFEKGLPLRSTLEACQRIGADTGVVPLRSLIELFPEQVVPEDYDVRETMVDVMYKHHAEYILRLESNFKSAKYDIERRLVAWIQNHNQDFPC